MGVLVLILASLIPISGGSVLNFMPFYLVLSAFSHRLHKSFTELEVNRAKVVFISTLSNYEIITSTDRASVVNKLLKSFLSAAFIVLGSVVATGAASAADEPIYTGIFSSNAVGGYDTVAYFTEGKPLKGKKKFQTEYMDTKWRFASQENLDKFLADPTKYAPQYGGYCAWAMAGGYKASGDPEQWNIVDGKLYLNYDAKIKAKWEVDIPGFIVKADVNYPEVVGLNE